MNIGMICGASLLALAAACTPAPAEPANQGDDIVGGTTAKAYPEAVLVDLLQGSRVAAACSGTLVAPSVVLTAGHCVRGFTSWRVTAPFAAGQRATSARGETMDWTADGEEVDPSMHDVALIYLDAPIHLDAYPKLATTAVTSSQSIVNVGRIQNGTLSDSALFVSKSMKVKTATSIGFPYDYVASEIIEAGDSGGGDFLTGAAPHTIVAVNSGAGGGTEVLARVDLVASWISGRIAGAPSSGSSDPTTPTTSCAHDPLAVGARLKKSCDPCVTAVCDADSYCCIHTWDQDCAAQAAETCGGCGDVDEAGRCDAETLLYCDGGRLVEVACGDYGLGCGRVSGGYDCE
jgi:hypothetical protein